MVEPSDGRKASYGLVNVEPGTERFADTYRVLAAELASGVAVVAARHRNRDHAVTVTGWLDVSWDPPTLAVSLFEEARICEAVEASGSWTLSVLNSEQQGLATWLASPGNPVEGLLTNVAYQRLSDQDRPGEQGPIVISDSLAWFHVETRAIHAAATHRIVVGEVTSMGRGVHASHADFARPLIHWARDFHELA
ncbi:flavin reductase family protein [Kocuria sp.]|uniref:flavin reductase family protein n=1 Tax=Kocuria sp. TaxID=1871328 RepID=UPI0026DF2E26|nr:flavin reductase family protein [Kocuria sp.]MDO5619725.1 flavin reductase family protein [Kocuria sp.]